MASIFALQSVKLFNQILSSIRDADYPLFLALFHLSHSELSVSFFIVFIFCETARTRIFSYFRKSPVASLKNKITGTIGGSILYHFQQPWLAEGHKFNRKLALLYLFSRTLLNWSELKLNILIAL